MISIHISEAGATKPPPLIYILDFSKLRNCLSNLLFREASEFPSSEYKNYVSETDQRRYARKNYEL